MSQLERAYRIDQLLNDRGVVGFDDLMHALEVSRATLMRDLAYPRSSPKPVASMIRHCNTQ